MMDGLSPACVFDTVLSNDAGALGFCTGVGASTTEAPRINYTKDPYYTDGLRVVIVIDDAHDAGRRPMLLGWETPSARDAVLARPAMP